MVAPESTSSIQEEEKNRFPSLLACTPPNTRQKQRPVFRPMPSTALTPAAGLSSQMHCVSCRNFRLQETRPEQPVICPDLPLQSPHSHPTATYSAMRPQTLWQRKPQQKSSRTGQQPSKKPRPSSRASNTASGCNSIHTTADLCPCQTCSMTAEHLLQVRPLHGNLRRQFWPVETTVARKLFISLEELWRTAAFMRGTGVSI